MIATHAQPEIHHAPPIRRCACGGVIGPTGECASCRAKRLAREGRSTGRSLDQATRSTMERSFGQDFSKVCVHADDGATSGLGASALTVGSSIITGSHGFSSPAMLAHELAHVVQQREASNSLIAPRASAQAESEARRAASAAASGGRVGAISSQPVSLARLDTGLAPDGGDTGLPAQTPTAPTPGMAMLCSRRLETTGIGLIANHAYVDDTGRGDCRGAGLPNNYAVLDLISGSPILGGCAVKTDTSSDPKTFTPNAKPCNPAPGIADVHACLRSAYVAYVNPNEYSDSPLRSPMGPNSNTFAATLAKTCCADSTSTGLGSVPGWDHAPAGPCPGTTAGGTTPVESESSPEGAR